MLKKIFCLLLITGCVRYASAQYESYAHKGEIGIGIGGNQYYGDLNPSSMYNHPKFTIGAFYLHHFNNYVGAKLSVNYLYQGFSDAYNNRLVYKRRNLSFNSNNWEATLSGSFNFFNFLPGIEGHSFTPYVSLGAGILNYNPYTYLNGSNEKIYLRPLGTEGQNSTTAHDGKKYGSIALTMPLALGVKWALSENINLFAEVGYRFTSTDYLDDVSTTYAGADAFRIPNYKGNAKDQWYAQQLQDRSNAVAPGNYIGNTGYQRGNSQQKDSYAVGQIGISFNINGYECPKAK